MDVDDHGTKNGILTLQGNDTQTGQLAENRWTDKSSKWSEESAKKKNHYTVVWRIKKGLPKTVIIF